MELNEKDIKKLIIMALIVILAFSVFFILKPIALTVLGGLILAYIFLPIYRKIDKKIKNPSVSSFLATLLAITIIIIPLWLFIPKITHQIFQMFLAFQDLNISEFVRSIFPTTSNQFTSQTSLAFDSFISKLTSGVLTYLTNLFLSFPVILLHVFLVGFVFFFALRDGDKIKDFLSEISPFNTSQNRLLLNQFKNLTDSIVYGQIIIGILQGIAAGVFLLIFDVPNALLLTLFAIILGVIPVIGPGFVYIPVAIYLFINGHSLQAGLYLVFNILIVSFVIEHVLRTYIVSKKAEVHPLVLFVGMIGGLFVLGILGVIIGPLILTYLITLLKAYREKTLGSIFKQ